MHSQASEKCVTIQRVQYLITHRVTQNKIRKLYCAAETHLTGQYDPYGLSFAFSSSLEKTTSCMGAGLQHKHITWALM